MKNVHFASALVLVSALAATGAMAQTGRPSEAPTGDAANVVDTRQDAAGSYAHYLMLNGTPRAEAIRAAQAIDHPAPRRFALHRARTEAPAQAQSQ
jgi:hypothetical protein